MPVQVSTPDRAEEKMYLFDLASPFLQLNLTADPWYLDPDKYAPKIIGRDVIASGTVQPEPGRRSAGNFTLTGLQTLILAEPSGLYGLQTVRISDIYANGYTGTTKSLKNTLKVMPSTGTIAWPTECLKTYIIKNADERNGPCEIAVITSRSTTTAANDTINFDPPFQNAWAVADKFSIVCAVAGDKRGIVISDGQYVDLISAGAVTKYLTMATAAASPWRCAQVASDRIMFVNPDSPPMIMSLLTAANTTAGILNLAGMFPPGSAAPVGNIIGPSFFRGLAGQFIGSSGSSNSGMTDSFTSRVLVRAINNETGAESELVQVRNAQYGLWSAPGAIDPVTMQIGFQFHDGIYDPGSPTLLNSQTLGAQCYKYSTGDQLIITSPQAIAGTYEISAGAAAHSAYLSHYPFDRESTSNDITHNGAFGALAISNITGYVKTRSDGLARGRLYVYTDNRGLLLPYDSKWTHLQIWRTTTEGGAYYLERTVEIPQELDPLASYPETFLAASTSVNRATCEMSDDQLIAQVSLTNNDVAGGRLPPCGRFITSLGGCTVIGGKGSANNFFSMDVKAYFVAQFITATHTVKVNGGYANLFNGYELQTGDVVVVTSPGGSAGTYTIATKTNDSEITLSGAGALPDTADPNFIGYIKRTVNIPWPYVKSDEEIRHSRPDKFAPDSFMSAPIRLSNIGDTMMAMVAVSNYVACIMKSGVHLLRNDAGVIQHDAIAVSAAGTPWENSVAVFEDMVVWAHPQGPKVMKTFPEINVNGQRADIGWLDKDNLTRGWFEEAFRLGYTIDTGIDTLNQCIRFRRYLSSVLSSQTNNSYETLQYCYRTGLWTILEDDAGFRYVRAKNVTAAAYTDERLYTVNQWIGAFEVNYQGTDFGYSGKTVQAVLDNTYTITSTYIQKAGVFDTAMVGDVIRFRSSNANVDGQKRVIITSTGSRITFADPVTGLAEGDEFLIGAVRFVLKSAPLVNGPIKTTAKTLQDVAVRALLGRATRGSAAPGKMITCRVYQNLNDTVAATAQDITIYDEDDDVAYTDADRVSSLAGQGSSLQVEIEHCECRSDFKIHTATVVTREESNLVTDQSSTG